MNSNKRVEHFVTLFDSNFLPQGMALHSSLERYLQGFYKLWILCLDDQVFNHLQCLGLKNIALLKLSQLETSELLLAKSTRSPREYCWTLTPFTASFVFDAAKDVDRVTYLDADTWFLRSPNKIFSELDVSGKSVLITEHAYASEHDQSETSGKYCVQFMTFLRVGGEEVRAWWQERCLEWCYARFEDGKFGDQKYLEKFPELFSSKVHAAQDLADFMAPWNAVRFSPKNAILWHFHGLRIVKLFGKMKVYYGDYFLPAEVLRDVYALYIQDIALAIEKLKIHDIKIPIQASFSWKEKVKYLLSKYFLQKDKFFLENLISLR
jgi:hypothetical protein